MADVVAIKKDLDLVNNYKNLAKKYGIFATKISVPVPGGDPKEYLVFSLSPIKRNVDPVAIANRNKRNSTIFYPESFAVEMNSENPLLIWERISNYLGYAELVYDLYEEFRTPMPKSIRIDELEALSTFYSHRELPGLDAATRMNYHKRLQAFFDNENPKSKFGKEWKEFYRSPLFDSDKSPIQNFLVFLKRNEPETSLDTLLDSTGTLKKVYMSEHHYKEFREIIKTRFPDVKYSVSDVQVVDEGIIVDPVSGKTVETPYGKTITQEEYDKIREERFATEGHACLDGLTPSYFEGRDIVYKACDENIIASVSHEIAYRWAKCSDLESLQQNGELTFVDIPAGHMMNFYSGVRTAGVPIYIDYNVNSSPNFETIRVVYNVANENTVHNLLLGLTMAQVALAHVSLNNKNVMFDVDVNKVDSLVKRARARALEAGTGDVPMIENVEKAEHSGPSLD